MKTLQAAIREIDDKFREMEKSKCTPRQSAYKLFIPYSAAIAYIKAVITALREVEGDAELRQDTAIRIALIAFRWFQKLQDESYGEYISGINEFSVEADGLSYLHSTIQQALSGFYYRPVHSIERLGLGYRKLDAKLVSQGAVTISQAISAKMYVGQSEAQNINYAYGLYSSNRPNPDVIYPLETEVDLPEEIPSEDYLPIHGARRRAAQEQDSQGENQPENEQNPEG